MLISSRGRYALLVMIDLAGHRGGLVPGRQIAERLELSQKYLERILRTLAEAGLIEGSHGKGGGYRLLRSPADYTAGEILRAAEGTLACLGEDVQLTPAETASGVSEVYRRLDAQIRAALDAVTLSSLTAADAGDEYVIWKTQPPAAFFACPRSSGQMASPHRGRQRGAPHPRLPSQGSWRRRRLRGCLFPARPLRLGCAEPPPLEGEALELRFSMASPRRGRLSGKISIYQLKEDTHMKILIVEDEKLLADSLRAMLEGKGFAVEAVYDGETGAEYAETGVYDLLILDVMMPGLDGYQVARQVRARRCGTPILMLTARSSLEDRIEGLNAGADYYLTKPFDTRELLACIGALLRRQGAEVNELSYGNTALDLSSGTLVCGEKQLRLSAREFDVMRYLLQMKGQNVSKEAILARVWGFDSNAVENHVEGYVGCLRTKLKAIGSNVHIEAARRLGYHLEVEEA